MKFIVSSSYLLKQLQVLGSVINSSNTLPILDNFLFELDNKALTVSASDLETTMSATLEIDSTSQGSVAVPAKLLLDILKTFPEQPLTFTVEENSTIEISSNSGKYAIAYAPGAEFPKSVNLDEPSTTLIPADVLATAISKTIFAAGNDDLRPVMSGVFFQFSPEGLIFVATDAHKLVKYARTDVKASEVADFIMPKKPLNILKSILGATDSEVKIDYNDSNATFSFDSYVLTCRLIDGKYPNYEAVIPTENPVQVTFNCNELVNAINAVKVASSNSVKKVTFNIDERGCVVSAEDIDESMYMEQMVNCNHKDAFAIAFNYVFLLETLKNCLPHDVTFEMSQPNRAMVMNSGHRLLLIMPVMLTN